MRNAKTMARLQERGGAISQIRVPETKGSSDLNGESTTIKGRKVAQEIKIQVGECSGVCLFPFFSYNL